MTIPLNVSKGNKHILQDGYAPFWSISLIDTYTDKEYTRVNWQPTENWSNATKNSKKKRSFFLAADASSHPPLASNLHNNLPAARGSKRLRLLSPR